jgi:DNA polymerase V
MMRADKCYLRAGIQQGAILVIDASAKAFDGSVVVVEYAGKFHLKRLQLLPEPSLTGLDYTGRRIPIDLTDMDENAATRIFGVLTHCVNDMRTAEFDDTPYGFDD